MSILMIGVDHNKADLDVRSVFSFTSKRIADALEFFMGQKNVSGCVMIATCNRTELWLSTSGELEESPIQMLCDHIEVDRDKYEQFFIERQNKEAVSHLFRLAAGLESKIVGEGQILTQIGDAAAFARSCYATDNTMEVLFRMAVTAGKRVRTEADLSTADRSVIHTALDNLREEGITVEGKKCMVIGNGMMGRLSAQTLMDQGADVTVTVRKYHSGVVDIPFGCSRINYEERYELLPSCDMIVSATSSPNYTLTLEELKNISVDHPIPLIDLAVPRDVEPEAAELSWASLYDIDSFHIDIRSEKFKQNLEKAEAILDEEKEHFREWYEGKDIVPLIQSLKKQAGGDVSARMTPFLRHTSLEPIQKEELVNEVEGASERMMNHLLFGLKSKLSDSMFRELLDSMAEVLSEAK
ncbi:MAG: glutamyl-tRNA reductase [Lachnospiraceae bacterium]|nr:glutamyl-tRNA reductase [Lachnospiraceae bacterium]